MNKRTENKYLINTIDSEQIEKELRLLCQKYSDKYTQYNVKSLYFDDIYNTSYYEKEEGFLNKQKFRLRVYNNDFENIYLESKAKQNNFVSKERCKLNLETAIAIVKDTITINESSPKILQKFYIGKRKNLFFPRIIIEYERTVYSFPTGNTRITIDKNIKSSQSVQNFFDKNICSKMLLPKGTNIIEIKYSGIYPPFLKDLINTDRLEKINYSKYYSGRKLYY